MIRKMKRCVLAHDVEPIQAALVILILAVGALSIVTFRALNTTKANQDRIEEAQAFASTAQHKLDSYQKLACERGNTLRAYLIIRGDLIGDAGGSAGSARTVFDLANCKSKDFQKPLSSAAADAYLDAVAARMGLPKNWRDAI